MLISEIVERLNDKETLKDVAKELSVGGDKLRKTLNSVGVEYDNHSKAWAFTGEGESPLTTSIVELLNKTRTRRSPQKGNTTTSEVKVFNTTKGLTLDEISTLRAIIKQYNETATTLEVDNNLHSRIIQLEADDKPTRKTVFLNKEVASQLDDFAKRNRVNNSDIVELAIMDFIAKYSK